MAVVVWGIDFLKICYVDESGDTGQLTSATSPVQPALVITGVILDHQNLRAITEDFINLKRRRFPNLTPRSYMSAILAEIKGAELRKLGASSSRNQRRQAFGFLNETLSLLETYDAKIIGRVWVKGIAVPISASAIYTFSIQSIYQFFNSYLTATNDYGVVIADSRTQSLNTTVSHSIFTQKFQRGGDPYDRIIELPAFSHSDNHSGLQLSDAVCSAFLFPLTMHSYCSGTITNVHVRSGYHRWQPQYGTRLKRLQYRYQEASGRWVGGVTVSDSLGQQGGGALFA